MKIGFHIENQSFEHLKVFNFPKKFIYIQIGILDEKFLLKRKSSKINGILKVSKEGAVELLFVTLVTLNSCFVVVNYLKKKEMQLVEASFSEVSIEDEKLKEIEKVEKHCFGLSIGANKSIAIWSDGKKEVKISIPSYIIMKNDGKEKKEEVLFGNEAEVYGIKKEETYELWKLINREIMEKGITKEQIISLFVEYMKKRIESDTEMEMKAAVVSIPEIWEGTEEGEAEDEKKERKKKPIINSLVADNIGLQSLITIDESIATLIAYGLNTKLNINKQVLVINMGKKNTTVTLISITEEAMIIKAEVRVLGGDAYTDKLMNYFINEFENKNQIKIQTNKKAMEKLKKACNILKHKLSTKKLATINVESITEGINFELVMTQEKFEFLCNDIFKLPINAITQVSKESKIPISQITDIIMAGGSIVIPKVNTLIRISVSAISQKCYIWDTIKSDEVVAYGTVKYASVLNDKLIPIDNNIWSFERIEPDLSVFNSVISSSSAPEDNPTIPVIPPSTSEDALFVHVQWGLSVELPEFEEKQEEYLQALAKKMGFPRQHLILITLESGSTYIGVMFKILQNKIPGADVKVYCSHLVQQINDTLETTNDSVFPGVDVKIIKKADMVDYFISKSSTVNPFPNIQSKIDLHSLSEFEKWLAKKTEELQPIVLDSLKQGPEEFEITSVVIVYNETLKNQFLQIHKNEDYHDSMALFKATRLKNIPNILDLGLNQISKTDNGWYGKGHYFTSFPRYAAYYAWAYKEDQKIRPGTFTMLCFLANCGKIKEIDHRMDGQEITSGFDSHYVRVNSNGSISGDLIYDEYCIRDGRPLLPVFTVTLSVKMPIVVWRDTKIENSENSGVCKNIQEYLKNLHGMLYCATTTEAAINILKVRKAKSDSTVVITNGAEQAKIFLARVRDELKLSCPVLVFCGNIQYHSTWASAFTNVELTTSGSRVLKFVKQYINTQEQPYSQRHISHYTFEIDSFAHQQSSMLVKFSKYGNNNNFTFIKFRYIFRFTKSLICCVGMFVFIAYQ
ncbi:heat shock protein 70 2 [Reticulomyxa filosa]|uniref:Heat shock protein 70 2 n=1 Tax=Reticulomyxa filosa TaxID=46433 RepID=X6NEQ3_RETFI|nr:heat shock protein 70 2 [Reticulomyxa filosa]|eukprot:ETO24810.1 heat shock protein 70 2 [Reticulomyxa filosa]